MFAVKQFVPRDLEVLEKMQYLPGWGGVPGVVGGGGVTANEKQKWEKHN